MKLKCLHCEHEFDGSISKDNFGWHSSCPKCECSFDVDVPIGRIIMAFAWDETDEYFTDDWHDDNELATYYAFNTPEEFMIAWKKMSECPDGMWYWVMDGDNCVCSGACDPYDIEIFEEYWNITEKDFYKDLLMEQREQM